MDGKRIQATVPDIIERFGEPDQVDFDQMNEVHMYIYKEGKNSVVFVSEEEKGAVSVIFIQEGYGK